MPMRTSDLYVDGSIRFPQEPVDIGYEDLKTETKESGRTYLDPDGHAYPSITTVLKIICLQTNFPNLDRFLNGD